MFVFHLAVTAYYFSFSYWYAVWIFFFVFVIPYSRFVNMSKSTDPHFYTTKNNEKNQSIIKYSKYVRHTINKLKSSDKSVHFYIWTGNRLMRGLGIGNNIYTKNTEFYIHIIHYRCGTVGVFFTFLIKKKNPNSCITPHAIIYRQ